MSEKLAAAFEIIHQHLEELRSEIFAPGAGMKLTFIARCPNDTEADILVSEEEDFDEITSLVNRSKDRPDFKAEAQS